MASPMTRSSPSSWPQITPGSKSPTVSPLEDEAWVAVTVMVRSDECVEVMDRLQEIGAESLLVFNVKNCRI
jgi:ATP phosphoribosyltransferase